MRPFKIEVNCDEWWIADSLHEIASEIENTDVLDDVEASGKAEIHGDHYDAVITLKKQRDNES